jgi:hypothetical protein
LRRSNQKSEYRNPWPRPGMRIRSIYATIAKPHNDRAPFGKRRARAGRNNIEIRISNDENIARTCVISGWKLDRMFCFEFWILNIRICPSTGLRMVSWSNHFEFRASRFGFFKEHSKQNIVGIQLVTFQNDRALGFDLDLGIIIRIGIEK